MKIKRLFSCILAVVFMCSCVLTGCSDKGTMFADMKEISQIRSAEFTSEGDFTMKSDDEDVQYHFVIDGKTDGKSAAVNVSVTSGIFTFTLEDFARMTDNMIYINFSSIFSSLFGAGDIDGLKQWVSIPFSAMDNSTASMCQSFSDIIIDSLEKASKGQDVSKNGDTWTLNIPGDKMISFAEAAVGEIDANLSSWYDMYVTILENTDYSELLKGYSSFMGEEDYPDEGYYPDTDEDIDDNPDSDEIFDFDTDEDPIQALKDGKEEAMNTWKEASASWKESLKKLSESIEKGEVATSGKLNITLSGKEGSRTAEEALDFQYEEKSSSNNIALSVSRKLTETDQVSVEAPDAADVMTLEEYSEWMSELFSLEDDYYSDLPQEEKESILFSLKEDQVYLYNSDSEDMVPYVITIDPSLYTIGEQIGDYYLDLDITNTEESFASLVYDTGSLKQDLNDYYLSEGDQTSTLSTDAGEIIWSTASQPDEWGSYVTTFGIQLNEDSYILGMLDIEEGVSLDVEAYIKGLLKEVKPFEASPSTSEV